MKKKYERAQKAIICFERLYRKWFQDIATFKKDFDAPWNLFRKNKVFFKKLLFLKMSALPSVRFATRGSERKQNVMRKQKLSVPQATWLSQSRSELRTIARKNLERFFIF